MNPLLVLILGGVALWLYESQKSSSSGVKQPPAGSPSGGGPVLAPSPGVVNRPPPPKPVAYVPKTVTVSMIDYGTMTSVGVGDTVNVVPPNLDRWVITASNPPLTAIGPTGRSFKVTGVGPGSITMSLMDDNHNVVQQLQFDLFAKHIIPLSL